MAAGNQRDSVELHRLLNLAGFRALATAAGLLQLCRELEGAEVLPADAIGRIRQAIFDELMEQAPRSAGGDKAFERRLRERLGNLFSGIERLSDDPVIAPNPC